MEALQCSILSMKEKKKILEKYHQLKKYLVKNNQTNKNSMDHPQGWNAQDVFFNQFVKNYKN